MKGAAISATSTVPLPTPAFSAASSVERERVRSRTPRSCGSAMWLKPVIQAGRGQTRRASSPAAITMAAAPSEIGAQSCLRSGDTRYGSARIFAASKSPFTCAKGFAFAWRRSRTATSAIARSETTPPSRQSRAWSAARLTASGQSGVST